jgi:hypothetical protein
MSCSPHCPRANASAPFRYPSCSNPPLGQWPRAQRTAHVMCCGSCPCPFGLDCADTLPGYPRWPLRAWKLLACGSAHRTLARGKCPVHKSGPRHGGQCAHEHAVLVCDPLALGVRPPSFLSRISSTAGSSRHATSHTRLLRRCHRPSRQAQARDPWHLDSHTPNPLTERVLCRTARPAPDFVPACAPPRPRAHSKTVCTLTKSAARVSAAEMNVVRKTISNDAGTRASATRRLALR